MSKGIYKGGKSEKVVSSWFLKVGQGHGLGPVLLL